MREITYPGELHLNTRSKASLVVLALVTMLLTAPLHVLAQTVDQPIYTDSLVNGWVSYGWATLNYANTSPVHSGSDSISVTAGGYQALYVHHSAFDSTPYKAIDFWINGGAGGQTLQVQAELSGTAQTPVTVGPLAAGTWQHVTISLSSLSAASQPNLDGFWIQNTGSGSIPTFYVDDVTLLSSGATAPTSGNITINASQPVRIIDPRLFGINTAIWDNQLGNPTTLTSVTAMGMKALRFPGGSSSDGYNWSTDKVDGNAGLWPGNLAVFNTLAQAAGAQPFLTVNYGNGTPQEAAAWVAYENAMPSSNVVLGTDALGHNWNTVSYWASMRGQSPLATDDGYNFLRVSHPAPFGVHYWEIGNEVYGGWEYDKHGSGLAGAPHDPYTYAVYAANFITLMKSVDPTIKIGVVSVTGEDSYGDGTHGVTNPNENGSVHTGWSAVMLRTLANLAQKPDFVIDHEYAQYPGYESDSFLLQASSGWPSISANIRKLLTDYFGAGSAGIEVADTEVNSVSSAPGKQTTSLVNGLYFADTLGAVAQTPINSCLWWDLHNATETNHNNSSGLYGWRIYGDYGALAIGDNSQVPANTPYPTACAAKLLSHWAAAGDETVADSSDYNLLSSYSALNADGSLSVLVINKSPNVSLTGHVSIAGFTPSSTTAATYHYGMTEDLANADLTAGTLVVSNAFDVTLSPYSMEVIRIPGSPLTIPASPASLSAVAAGQTSISLTWPAVSQASWYTVYRSAVSGGPYSVAASNVTNPGTTDTNVMQGAHYYYVVTASNTAGESGKSPEATATTAYVPYPAQNLAPIADSFVTDGNAASTNFGTAPYLIVKNVSTPNYDRATYLKFDLTHLPAAPNTALLTLLLTQSNTSGATSGTIKAYGIADTSWGESQITYNSALGSDSLLSNFSSSGTYIGSATVSTSQAFYTWDLSSYLKDKAGKVVTILLTNDSPNGIGWVFNSKEAGFGAPSLVVDFGGASPSVQTPPAAPSNLTIGSVSASSVSLNWVASTGATSYDIYRSAVSNGPYTHIATSGTALTYSDTSVSSSSTYYYVVTASNSSGPSPYSNQVTAATPAVPVPTSPTVLLPVADTYVQDGGYANSNYGTSPYVIVKNAGISGYDRVSYVTFDLTSITTAPKSASLTVTVTAANSMNSNPAKLSVYGISNTGWLESALTWNTALTSESLNSNITSSGVLAATLSVPAAPGTITWDVSSYLADKAGKKITLQIIDPQPDGAGFVISSREATSGQPKLSLSY